MALHHGDLFDVLPTLPADSIEACVTDPPYELAFMSKRWDSSGVAFQVETWQQVYRVLKPGAHLLAFGGTRTSHRMVCAIEDAGFEIRDSLCWLYGSGFPKSLNVSKAIDEAAGAERQIVGKHPSPASTNRVATMGKPEHSGSGWNESPDLTAPATDAAKQWDGWGTALKPAMEVICLARKPLIGTVVANVLAHGTGALNIDACRIAVSPDEDLGDPDRFATGRKSGQGQWTRAGAGRFEPGRRGGTTPSMGRWPSNVLLDESAAAILDAQSGELHAPMTNGTANISGFVAGGIGQPQARSFTDSGGASRFFFTCQSDCILCEQPCRTTSADSAASRSETIHRTIGASALSTAHASLAESLALAAPYVANLCAKCVTSIALALAEIKCSGSSALASTHYPAFMPDYKSSTLRQSLVSFAELWANIDTIPTTASLSLLYGSVVHAIEGCTRSGNGAGLASIKSGPTRFLYSPKPSREERDYGCDGLIAKTGGEATDRVDGSAGVNSPRAGAGRTGGSRNHHPTVKPVELMRYLVKLIVPPNGTCLDPFMGSGTTGMACRYELRQFIGIERDPAYIAIAERRIADCAPLFAEMVG